MILTIKVFVKENYNANNDYFFTINRHIRFNIRQLRGVNMKEFNKYDFITKVIDNAPVYDETMSDNEFNYYRGYCKALLDVCDVFDEFNN